MNRPSWKALFHRFALAATVIVALASVFVLAEDSKAPADDPAGAAAYKSKCNSCHGPDGSGNTPVGKSLKVADLRSDTVQKKSDAELIQFVADGKGNMPSFRNSTTDDQLKVIVAHVRFLGAKKAN